MENTELLKISVIVCTRNRAQSLAHTIESVLALQCDGSFTYELLIVDNGSTDDTRTVVEAACAKAPGIVRYMYEPRAGLSIARNTGVLASTGEVLAFTDDDVRVAPDWLIEIQREFAADLQLLLAGGRILLARPELQPVTIKTSELRETFCGRGDYNALYGANMVFRRRLFDELGGFDARLGAGCYLAGGDEADLLYRALQAGHHILYAPNILVYHDHGRTEFAQALRMEFGYGKGQTGLLMKHMLAGDAYAAKIFYWSLRGMPRRWFSGDPQAAATKMSRAHCRGIVVSLLKACWILSWQDSETAAVRGQRQAGGTASEASGEAHGHDQRKATRLLG